MTIRTQADALRLIKEQLRFILCVDLSHAEKQIAQLAADATGYKVISNRDGELDFVPNANVSLD